MSDQSAQNFDSDFHERLARFWPEPRAQLHHGGWEQTYALIERIQLQPHEIVLDYCCGEGGTANWLAQTVPNRVIGFDISPSAVQMARQAAQAEAITTPPHYFAADAFAIPLASASVHVIIGQDPDALGNMNRQATLAECYRLLKPAGRFFFHHYVLHDDAPPQIKQRYNAINAEMGFPTFGRLTQAEYVADSRAVGFEVEDLIDMSAVYAHHLRQMRDKMHAQNEPLDAWTAYSLEAIAAGAQVGFLFVLRKPD